MHRFIAILFFFFLRLVLLLFSPRREKNFLNRLTFRPCFQIKNINRRIMI